MNHVKWTAAALALVLLASCGGPRRTPAPEELRASPRWRPGAREVSEYRGSGAIDPASRDALGRLAIGIDAAPPADPTGAGLPFRVELQIVAPPYAPHDTSSTVAVLDRRTLEPIGIEAEVRGPGGGLARAIPAGADSIRLEVAGGGEPRTGTFAWPDAGRPRVCWDALPLWLRQWAREKTPFEMAVWLLPPLSEMVANGPAKPVDAVVRRMDGGVIGTPAGRFDAVEFAVARDGEADAFWFSTSAPHPLLKVQTARHLALELGRPAGGRPRPRPRPPRS